MCQESCTAQTRDRGSAEGGKQAHQVSPVLHEQTGSNGQHSVGTGHTDAEDCASHLRTSGGWGPAQLRGAIASRWRSEGRVQHLTEQLVMLQPCTAIVPREL